jgi:hypothetical protein
MGLFSNRDAPTPRQRAAMGSGRKLRSSLTAAAFHAAVEALMAGYHPPKRPGMPAAVPAGHHWQALTRAPSVALCGDDNAGDFLLVAVWDNGNSVEAGVFPLGTGDERLRLPFIGHLKQRDPSLTSIGVIPAGSITLQAPRVPPHLPHDILRAAGLAASPRNIELICQQIASMFLIKAHQFMASEDRRAADAFVANNRPSPGLATQSLQRILDNLGAWNPQVLPYLQDLPYRVRSILLERDQDGQFSWALRQ